MCVEKRESETGSRGKCQNGRSEMIEEKSKAPPSKTEGSARSVLTDRIRLIAEILGRGLPGKGLGAGLGKFEADEPVAGDAVAVHFRRSEFPPAGGLESEIGEIFARAGRIQFGLGDISSGLDVDADRHANFAVNGAASFFGDVGQHLFQDLPARGRGGGGFWRVGRWKRVGP